MATYPTSLDTLTNPTASARYRPRVATHDVTGVATGARHAEHALT